MTQALELHQDDRVLEIGTGSGYQAAILSQIVYRVYTIERIRSLHIQARSLFDKLQYHNIVTRYGDGTKGWQQESPFDAIIVTAGAPEIPEILGNQLVVGGRLVVPVGNQHTQELIKIDRRGNRFQQTNLGGCRFVKLVGEHGWRDG
jgi:protein-L-isoaspartate(D-aspartate) O-methyltransferase